MKRLFFLSMSFIIHANMYSMEMDWEPTKIVQEQNDELNLSTMPTDIKYHILSFFDTEKLLEASALSVHNEEDMNKIIFFFKSCSSIAQVDKPWNAVVKKAAERIKGEVRDLEREKPINCGGEILFPYSQIFDQLGGQFPRKSGRRLAFFRWKYKKCKELAKKNQ